MSWPPQDSSGNRLKQTYIKGFLDISGGDVIVRNQGNVTVGGNITMGGNSVATTNYVQSAINNLSFSNISLTGTTIFNGDASFNGNLFIKPNSAYIGGNTNSSNLIATRQYVTDAVTGNISLNNVQIHFFCYH